MSHFKELLSIEEVEFFIDQNTLAFLYIFQQDCSVCHGLEPQVKTMLDKYPAIRTRSIDASKVTEVAGYFTVFTAPVLLLFVNGKEYIREARFVQTDLLDYRLARIYENMVD